MDNGTYVLVVAGGRGSRAKRSNDALPKQYVSLNGKSILEHVLTKFQAMDVVDGILTVIHPDDIDIYESVSKTVGPKMLPYALGGDTRQASVLNGLIALEGLTDITDVKHVLIHDGARPCFSDEMIDRVVKQLDHSEAVLPALAVSDTLKRVKDGVVTETVDRQELWRAQTPQSFNFQKILLAHKAAEVSDHASFTDDCSIAEWYGMDIDIVLGEERNIKITTVDDFERGEHYLSNDIDVRVGQGFDVHCFEAGDEVILCGVAIPFEKKLKGHSDADVGLHALTDALYGAIGEGDIGTHFPPSDEQWKGAASDIFLKAAAELVRSKGARISNVDVTLICEAPKIGPHSVAMREAIAGMIGIDVSRVSVKATTTEKLGFNGRGEGISALASATVIF